MMICASYMRAKIKQVAVEKTITFPFTDPEKRKCGIKMLLHFRFTAFMRNAARSNNKMQRTKDFHSFFVLQHYQEKDY